MATHPAALARAQAELDAADGAGLLGRPVQFEEARAHLPYTSACIREGHRLHAPVANTFPRVVPPTTSAAGGADGRVVDGVHVPGGADVMSVAYVVHRDPELYGPDPEAFRPERWLVGEGDEEARERVARMEAANFAFGMGPRICLGKELALLETYKVVAEVSPTTSVQNAHALEWRRLRGALPVGIWSGMLTMCSRSTTDPAQVRHRSH